MEREWTQGRISIGLFVALHLVGCGDDWPSTPTAVDGGPGDAGRAIQSQSSSVTASSTTGPGPDDTSSSNANRPSSNANRSSSNADRSSSSGTNVAPIDSSHSSESSLLTPETGAPSDGAGTRTYDDPATDAAVSDPVFTRGTNDAGGADSGIASVCIPLDVPLTTSSGRAFPEVDDARVADAAANITSAIADAGLGALDADVHVEAGAGSAHCFPSCITEVESLCVPGEMCNAHPGNGGLTACWDNGLLLDRTQINEGNAVTTTSRVYVDTQVCYTVEAALYLDGSGAVWTWLDSCGETIATAHKISDQIYTVSCAQRNETRVVDMGQGACTQYVDGAPNMFTCEQGWSCP